jgi:hypothetical protein
MMQSRIELPHYQPPKGKTAKPIAAQEADAMVPEEMAVEIGTSSDDEFRQR